jgi:hypothetical protein
MYNIYKYLNRIRHAKLDIPHDFTVRSLYSVYPCLVYILLAGKLWLFISNSMAWGRLVIKWPRNPRQVCGIPEREARGDSANLPRVRSHLITNLPKSHAFENGHTCPTCKLKHLLLCLWDVKACCTCALFTLYRLRMRKLSFNAPQQKR